MGQKIKKSPGQKKSWNQINQFHDFFFDQIPFFAISKMVKNLKSIFKLGKSLKLLEMQFHEEFCLDFIKFSGPLCEGEEDPKIS